MRTKLLAGILLIAFPVLGQSRQCKNNPSLIGACYLVHGRATFGAGTPAL
jgi:hypothetical protein